MAAFDFPSSPTVGQIYTANGITYKWDGLAWIGGPAQDLGAYVLKAGDTMSGNLRIDPPSGEAYLTLDKSASGLGARIYGQMSASPRWQLSMGNATAEAGSNSGSDFQISRYNDAGTFVDSPLVIERASGTANFLNIVTPNLNIQSSTSGNLTLAKTAGANACAIGAYTGVPASGAGLRWQLQITNGNPETGGNVGSDFALYRYSDVGAYVGNPLVIPRSNGMVIANEGKMMVQGATPTFNWYDTTYGGVGFYNSAANFYIGAMNSANSATANWVWGAGTYMWTCGAGQFGMQDNGTSRIYSWQANTFCYSVTTTGWVYWSLAGSSNVMSLPPNGYLDIVGATPTKAGAGQWAARSDERIKHEVKDFKLGLDELLKLKPRRFKYRREAHASCGQQEQVGFIAQEVEEIWPDMVFRREKDSMGEIEIEEMRVIDITALQFGLLNAVKDLKAQLDAALERIAQLEGA